MTTYYACSGCGKSLFLEEQINGHEEGDGQEAFRWAKRDSGLNLDGPSCSAFFVNRMDWMGAMDANEGKIACPKCKTKLGKYFWHGTQCSCGAWVTPAIQVLKAKVDAKTLR